MRLANAFRGIDASESDFLNEVAVEQAQKEWERKKAEEKELHEFKEAARRKLEENPPLPPALISSTSTEAEKPPKADSSPLATSSVSAKPKPGKRKRDLGLGIVRKKPAPNPAATNPTVNSPTASSEKDARRQSSQDSKPVDQQKSSHSSK